MHWDMDRGFSFVHIDALPADVFIHYTELLNVAYLGINQTIECDVIETEKGLSAKKLSVLRG